MATKSKLQSEKSRKSGVQREEGITSGVKLFTPQEAFDILSQAPEPPKNQGRLILELKANLMSGRVQIDGDPITVLEDGSVVSGAEKLYACFQSDIPFPSVYVSGVRQADPALSGDFVRRTRSDFLHAEGVEHASSVAQVFNSLYSIALRRQYHTANASRMRHEHLTFYKSHFGDLQKAVEATRNIPNTLIPKHVSRTCYAIFSLSDPEKAFYFLNKLGFAAKNPQRDELFDALIANIRTYLEATEGQKRPRHAYFGFLFDAWLTYQYKGAGADLKFTGKRSKGGFEHFVEPPEVAAIPLPDEVLPENQITLTDSDKERLAAKYAELVDKSEIEIVLETIPPTFATFILENANDQNRPIRESYVQRYKRMMSTERWELNGKTIKFNSSGLLRDGQHRLAAAARAGLPLTTFVVRNLPDDIFVDLDQIGKTTLRHILAGDGYKNAQGLSSALGCLRYFPDDMPNALVYGESTSNKISDLSLDEQRNLILERHLGLVYSADRYGARALKNVLTQGVVVATHYVLAREDKEGATEFFDQLTMELGEGDFSHPGQQLRSIVTNHNLSTRKILPKRTQIEVMKAAYQAMKDGDPLNRADIMKIIRG